MENGVGPQQVIDNSGKELKIRSIFRPIAAFLGAKRAF
jgi:hypothetical protein